MEIVGKKTITVLTLIVFVAIVLLVGGKDFLKGAVTVDASAPLFHLEMSTDLAVSQEGISDYRGVYATADYLGKRGGAWVFNGKSDYVVTSSTHLKSLEEFTIMFWFKPADLNLLRRGHMLWQGELDEKNNGQFAGDGWGPQQELHLSLGDETDWKTFEDRKLTFYFGDEKSNLKISTLIKNVDWQHVAVTVRNSEEGAMAKLYLDGAYIGTATSAKKIKQEKWGDSTLLLGKAEGIGPKGIDANRYFQGQLDELAIYGEMLDEKDIFNLCWQQNKGVVCGS